jgi:2Fe-2S ferredoxin
MPKSIRALTVGSLVQGQPVSSSSRGADEVTLNSSQGIDNRTVKQSESKQVSKKKEKHPQIVRLTQQQQDFEVVPRSNQLLLEEALSQNQLLSYKCKKGTCGVCTVEIKDGQSLLHSPNTKEEAKLNDLIQDNYRLACQALFI